MLRRWTAILLLVLGAVGTRAEVVPPLQKTESPLADSLAKKIQLIRARYEQDISGAMEVEVSEEEANAYLLHRLAGQLPEGIVEPWVRFTEGPVWVGATLDLALLQERMPQFSLTQLLSGRMPVEVSAQLHAEDGVGKLDLQSVMLGGIPLPRAFVQELVTTYTKGPSRPDGIRLEDPFELPYGIESVQTETGRVLLRQVGGSASPAATRPRDN